jgi:tripartite-type tricarboxylate transporter receptor subunit TctC
VDTLTRIMGPQLGALLGQQVIADNRPGAGTSLAAELVAKSPSDGYTLLMATSSFTINPSLYKKIPYDPVTDFVPIGLVASTPFCLSVHPSLPVRSVKEFIALAKRRPDQIYFGSSGNGSSLHLAGEMFKSATGAPLVHVPYKGGTPAVTALVSGEVQAVFTNILSVLPHVKAGKLHLLAVTSAKRATIVPDVPTLAESGVPGFDFIVWWGLMAPKGTPAAVTAKVNAAVAKALQAAPVRERLQSLAVEPIGSTPQAFADTIAADLRKFPDVVRKAGARID